MALQLKPERRWAAAEKLALRERLRRYYAEVPDYTAFGSPSAQVHCWEFVAAELRQRVRDPATGSPEFSLLEVGAGRSGLGSWLAEHGLRSRVHWVAQDVTPQNEHWLRESADDVVIGDVADIDARGRFDVIVSTYVLEHTVDPQQHLAVLKSLLAPGGSLFLFCPRYDVPGYATPSSRHLSRFDRLGLSIRAAGYRLLTLISGTPAFLIQSDLAAFHGRFFVDADAVHWSSLLDLRLWARREALSLRTLAVGTPAPGTRDWIVKRLLTCSVQITKN